MIVAERKQIDEITTMIESCNKVLVLGCGGCVTVCLTGGERQADALAAQLKLAASQGGKTIEVDVDCITRQCEAEFFDNLASNPGNYDAVVSIACGAGVGYMSERFPQATILPGMNTTFLASNVAKGIWEEYCRGCGDCVLAWTGGICPIARCSKSLINGACGGTDKGMCEVSNEMDCAWFLIYERLKKAGRLDELRKLRSAKDWRTDRGAGVRRLVLREMVEEEADE